MHRYLLPLFLIAPSADLYASCGAAYCPIDASSHEAPKGGNVRLDVSFQYIDQSIPRVGQNRAPLGQVPNPDHDEIATLNRLWTFRADYDLNDRWGFGLTLPVINRAHDHLDVATGDVDHWGFTGVGDLEAQIRYGLLRKTAPEDPSVTLSATGKFPTGRTRAHNEFEDAEVTIQPGSGSYDVSGSIAYSQNLWKARTLQGEQAWVPVFLSASYRRNNPGTNHYRIGDSVQVNAGSAYTALRKLDLLGQINLIVKRKNDAGDTTEDTSFTGGNFLYLSPGFRWHWTPGLSSYAYVQLPVYQRVNQEQDTSWYNAMLGLTYQFGGLPSM